MTVKAKNKEFRFTFQTFLRVLIFFLIVILLINYFASSQDKLEINDPTTILGEEFTSTAIPINLNKTVDGIYNSLPESSRYTLENFNQNPALIFVQDKLGYIQQELNGFPETQIKNIKKAIINSIYTDMMQNLEN